MRQKMPLGIRFVLGAVSFLLCILLFVSTLAAATLGDLSVVFRQDNLKKLLTEVVFSSATHHAPVGRGTSGGGHSIHITPAVRPAPIRSDNAEGEENSAMVAWIYDSLKDQYPDVPMPSLEEVQEFVKESTLSDFLTDKTASLISDLYTGNNTTTLTDEEIRHQLEINARLIEETFDIPMTDAIIDQIVAEVEKVEVVQSLRNDGVNAVVNDMLSGGALGSLGSLGSLVSPPVSDNNGSDFSQEQGGSAAGPDSSGGDLTLLQRLQTITTPATLIGAIAVCVVLMGLLIVTNLKRIWLGIIDSGITLLVAGTFLTVPTVLVFTAEDSLRALLNSLAIEGLPVGAIVIFLLKLTAPIHIGILVGGLLILAGGITTWVLLRKKALAAAGIPAEIPVEEPAGEPAAESEEPTAESEERATEPEEPAQEPAEPATEPV